MYGLLLKVRLLSHGRINQKAICSVDWFSSLSDGSKRSIVIFGGIAAAIGPVVFGLGAFISTIGNAVTVLAPLLASIVKAGGLISFYQLKCLF